MEPWFIDQILPNCQARERAQMNKTENTELLEASSEHMMAGHTRSKLVTNCFGLPTSKDEMYPLNRGKSFSQICASLGHSVALQTTRTAIAEGDSLELIKRLPDHSVDLILTDPPYHSTKKQNIYGDADFAHDDEFRDWVKAYVREWKRILKPNGSLYLFCSSDMAPFLYTDMSDIMNMHGIITWSKPNEPGYDGWKQKMKKTSLRRWYPHTERIIFCSPATEGNLKRSPFGLFLKDCRKISGLTSNMLTELTGAYGKVNNGGAVSNWETGRNIPSRDQYAKICEAVIGTGNILFMPAYEDVVRAFNVDPEQPFIDVWDFMNVRQYRGKHPAEKPQDMLSHIIRTSSYENDVVLDCFSGSGSTNIAAHNCNRYSVGIEIEQKWIDYSIGKIKNSISRLNDSCTNVRTLEDNISPSLPLFRG